MGKAITYCVQCSKRVSDSDLESGKAFKIGDRILCRACAPESVKTQSSKKIVRAAPGGTSVALKAQKLPPDPAPASIPRKKLFILAGGAAAAVLLILVLVLLLRKGDSPPVAKEVDAPTPAPPTLPADARAASSKADLDKARAYAKAHAEDLPGQLKEFTEIVWKWEGTDAAKDAAQEAALVKASILAKVKVWMDEAEAQLKELLAKGDFAAAVKRFESLKPSHDLPEWRLAVEKRVSELYREARNKKEKEESEKAALPDPAPPKPADKPPSEEARSYRSRWEAAAARATARDFGSALSDLERAAAGLKDDDVKAEAAQDVDDLKRVAALRTASLDALKKKVRGAGLWLSVRRPSGEVQRLGGMILQTDAQRVEIQTAKGSAFVEWAELAASALAEAGSGSKAEPRTLALICLLEGEGDAAKSYEAALPPKWWTYAEGARTKLPPPEESEKPARELYYSAEKGFRAMETRPAAVENYRVLKADYGSTSLVKSYAERVARRAEAGREYFFAPADFRLEGTLRLAKSGKIESIKDTDEPDTLLNFAEIDFAALSGLGYRCWVWVGACCEETFLFYLQGTEITDTDPKTRKKIACEPGATFATPAKLSLRNLKKTHEEHRPKGAKVHPKTAARWEWIEVPLPKYAAPGAKKVRIMTHHAGYSVGGAVVSSTRKSAPVESELKDLEKDREVGDALPVDPDLIAWWGFDEGEGKRVADLSGKGHPGTVVGAIEWVEGKIGGGMRFGEPGPGVQVQDAEDLRLSGDLTMAFWMKREEETGEWSCLFGKGLKEERNYGLWLEAKTQQILFQQYGPAAVNLKSQKAVPNQVWTHVVATVVGDRATLYLNGAKDSDFARGGPAATSRLPVGLGWANDHGTFRGILDDVRLYRRGLTADEVRALYEQTR